MAAITGRTGRKKKAQKCPFLSSTKTGKWLRLACSLPAGQPCPDTRCPARPDHQEPDPDAED